MPQPYLPRSPPQGFALTDSRCNGFVLAQQQSFPIQSGKHSTNSRTKAIRPGCECVGRM